MRFVLFLLAAASARPEAINYTIAGKPVAMLRFASTGLKVSASCRKGGRLACQALSALAEASRRSAESVRHGVGGIDCPDFQATRVDPTDGQPVCKFGDGSLIRMANLYANVCQLGVGDFAACYDMITTRAAKLMNRQGYGIAVGHDADLVVLDCDSPAAAVAELAPVLHCFKHGRRTVTRQPPVLHRP